MNSLRQEGVDLIRHLINEPAMTASRRVLLRMRKLRGDLLRSFHIWIIDGQSQNHSTA